jgi:hypothetical protein
MAAPSMATWRVVTSAADAGQARGGAGALGGGWAVEVGAGREIWVQPVVPVAPAGFGLYIIEDFLSKAEVTELLAAAMDQLDQLAAINTTSVHVVEPHDASGNDASAGGDSPGR